MLEIKWDERRTHRITVMITDTEWKALKAKATEELRSLNDQASLILREGMIKERLVKMPEKTMAGRD